MFVDHEQARERFDRLTKPSAGGSAFYPHGAWGAGYRLDEPTARRVKLYFAYQFLVSMGLFMVVSILFQKQLDGHPFFAALILGAVFWAIDLLVMRALLLGSPRVSTRLRADEFVVDGSRPSSRLETTCGLVNTSLILLLLVVFAAVTRSVDAWLFAGACAAFLAYMASEVRKGRRQRRGEEGSRHSRQTLMRSAPFEGDRWRLDRP